MRKSFRAASATAACATKSLSNFLATIAQASSTLSPLSMSMACLAFPIEGATNGNLFGVAGKFRCSVVRRYRNIQWNAARINCSTSLPQTAIPAPVVANAQ